MNILMSIVDFFPVVMFLIGALYLQRDLYNKMSKGAFALFAAGTIFVIVAGAFKATHKILYFARVCDFSALSKCFFPMQTVGFVLAGAGVLAMLIYPQGENKAYSFLPILPIALIGAEFVAPAEWSGTMLFVALMVLGVMVLDGCLIYVAVKQKNVLNIVLLAISFIFVLGMGYLSTKEDMSDWYKEIVNTIGQGSFMVAAIMFHKKGLAELELTNK